jgi:hypothetical protein
VRLKGKGDPKDLVLGSRTVIVVDGKIVGMQG